MMKLFGHTESGHAYKVKLMLAVADIEHEYTQVDIFAARDQRLEEFRKHSRFSEVPLLIDDGVAYVQSNAILLHLANKSGGWGAEDIKTLNRCTEWLFWEANKIGMCLPQLRSANRFSDAPLADGALQWLLKRYDHDIQLLDAEFSDGRQFVLGDRPTIADFSLCGYLFFANEAKVSVPKNVGGWLSRLAGLPGWEHPYELLSTDKNAQ